MFKPVVFRYTLLLFTLVNFTAQSKSIIQQATWYQEGQTLMVNVVAEINFPTALQEALRSGLPLTLQYQFELSDKAWYKLTPLAKLNKTYHIVYHRLTERYVVSDSVTVEKWEFPHLFEVKQFLQTLRAFPLILVSQLPETATQLSIRFHLSSENLPVYISIERYFNDDWEIDSHWHHWSIP